MDDNESFVVYDYVRQAQTISVFSRRNILKEISSIGDNADKLKFVSKFLDEHGLLDRSAEILKIPKNDKNSEKCRNQGNQFYARSDYIAAVENYNKSLCFAESKANLALAYANRSAVCFELKMYQACLQNIEMAKSHGYPAEKIHQLDLRAEKCHRLIAEGAESDEDLLKPSGEEFLKLSHPPHPKLPYIADCLEIKCDENFGRHIVTNKRLLPGDIVCIEPPFTKSLFKTHKYCHCINCMENNFLSLITCTEGTSAMFCSQECKDEAFESSYKYKVDIIDELHRIIPNVHLAAIESFFTSLKICDGNLDKLRAIVEENEANPPSSILDVDDPTDPINILKTIDAFVHHEDKRTVMQNYLICGAVAIIAELFLEHTKLGHELKTESDRDFFRCFLLKHAQIAMINYHCFGKTTMSKVEFAEGRCSRESAYGSFPFLSMISHSCSPNMIRFSNNSKIHLIVQRPIEPGEQLLDSYSFVFDLQDYDYRQYKISANYFFQCKCEACVNKYPLFACLPARLKDAKSRSALSTVEGITGRMYSEQAKKFIWKIRKMLVDKDRYYPCQEIIKLQYYLVECHDILLTSKLSLQLGN